jgi:hypothetical protein
MTAAILISTASGAQLDVYAAGHDVGACAASSGHL